MSHLKNKVNWCLKKAKKELDSGFKHRGLLKINSNLEVAKLHIKKAEHNFEALLLLEDNNFSDWAVSAAFYSIYHCFLAILSKKGYESRNQECTLAIIRCLKEEGELDLDDDLIETLNMHDFDEAHMSSVISLREFYQYGVETSIVVEKLFEIRELCKKAIAQTKDLIY